MNAKIHWSLDNKTIINIETEPKHEYELPEMHTLAQVEDITIAYYYNGTLHKINFNTIRHQLEVGVMHNLSTQCYCNKN